MATEYTRPYPKAFEKAWASWDEETKKMAACLGWSMAMKTTLAIIKCLRERGDNNGGQEPTKEPWEK